VSWDLWQLLVVTLERSLICAFARPLLVAVTPLGEALACSLRLVFVVISLSLFVVVASQAELADAQYYYSALALVALTRL
jgi:hypothetical protein